MDIQKVSFRCIKGQLRHGKRRAIAHPLLHRWKKTADNLSAKAKRENAKVLPTGSRTSTIK